jgi:hypothetical protein
MTHWFYEYECRKYGPVPQETIEHLTKHRAIGPRTRLWRRDASEPVEATQLPFLQPHFTLNEGENRLAGSTQGVRLVLERALDAVRSHTDESLANSKPPILYVGSSFIGVSAVALIDYRVLAIEPRDVEVRSDMPSPRTAVRQYTAIVRADVCKPFSWQASVEELRKHGTDKRQVDIVLDCIERADGSWQLFELMQDKVLPKAGG